MSKLGLNCFQRLSADDKDTHSKERVKVTKLNSVLPRPRSRENIVEISAMSQPKHPSCESCHGGIFGNNQFSHSVWLLLAVVN